MTVCMFVCVVWIGLQDPWPLCEASASQTAEKTEAVSRTDVDPCQQSESAVDTDRKSQQPAAAGKCESAAAAAVSDDDEEDDMPREGRYFKMRVGDVKEAGDDKKDDDDNESDSCSDLYPG